ncbi:MAG: hypothetical protein KDI88_16435, partial [Gammaproteobacteria bacterium]|nr:hypothetical protein [Gammaproteobacteria bacterium]
MQRRYGLVIAWMLLPVCALAADMDARATLRFATTCANCHEGECSGRMSFSLAPQAAFTHIRQYAGPVDDDLAHGLHGVLERMKAECRYAMWPTVDLATGELDGADLDARHDAWSGRYFIPLPELNAGHYRIAGDLPG